MHLLSVNTYANYLYMTDTDTDIDVFEDTHTYIHTCASKYTSF